MNRNKVSSKAPKKKYNNYKTSDRRSAVGYRVNQYLHNPTTQLSSDTIEKIKSTKTENNSTAVVRRDPKTGKEWHDTSLTEWDASHFRLFVGNIGNDVTEELLIQTFIKYKSLSKVKVPIDQTKNENKGFAFLSFADADDYLKCYREMNGQYVGNKPISLERAKTEIGEVVRVKKNQKKKGDNSHKKIVKYR